MKTAVLTIVVMLTLGAIVENVFNLPSGTLALGLVAAGFHCILSWCVGETTSPSSWFLAAGFWCVFSLAMYVLMLPIINVYYGYMFFQGLIIF